MHGANHEGQIAIGFALQLFTTQRVIKKGKAHGNRLGRSIRYQGQQ
jgi:hypothetical protein